MARHLKKGGAEGFMNTTVCLVRTCLLCVCMCIFTHTHKHVKFAQITGLTVSTFAKKTNHIPRCRPPVWKEINQWPRCCEVSFCTDWIVNCKLHLNTLYSFSYKAAATTNAPPPDQFLSYKDGAFHLQMVCPWITKKISSRACVNTLWAVFCISNSVHCNKVFQRAKHFLLTFWKLLLHFHSSSFFWHTLDLQRNIWLSFIQKSFTFYNPALFPWSMLGSKRQYLYHAFLSFSTSVLFCSLFLLKVGWVRIC